MKYHIRHGNDCEYDFENHYDGSDSGKGRCCIDLIAVILSILFTITISLILGAVFSTAILTALIPLIILAIILLILLVIRLIALWCYPKKRKNC